MTATIEKKKTNEKRNSTFTIDPAKDILHTFPTPILNVNVGGTEALNQGLKKIILEKMKTDTGVKISNDGGWHSNTDIFLWPHKEIEALQSIIDRLLKQMIQFTAQNKNFNPEIDYSGWANVNQNRDYNKMHNHPGSHWSGCYYVDTGDDEVSMSSKSSGKLVFQDPRGFAGMLPMPGTRIGEAFELRPSAGKLTIFPSFIFHAVNPYEGKGTRISIAFNAFIRGRAK